MAKTEYNIAWVGAIDPLTIGTAKGEDVAAATEIDEGKYTFGRLGEAGLYSVIVSNENENDTMFVVAFTKTGVGCSCQAFKDGGKRCRHIIAIQKLGNDRESLKRDGIAETMMINAIEDTEKWTFDADQNMIPPQSKKSEVPKTPAGDGVDTGNAGTATPEVVKESKEPEPDPATTEPVKIRVKCPHCNMQVIRSSQAAADTWVAKHLMACKKNPVNMEVPETHAPATPPPKTGAPPPPPPDMPEPAEPPQDQKRVCEICGASFDTIDALLNHVPDCKQAHEDAKEVAALPALIANMDWTAAEVEVMRKTVANHATIEEFAYFLNVAKAVGLNPFLKEIYFMKTEKGQVAIITGRDGFLKIAKRDPNFEGLYSMEICEKDEFSMSFEPDESGRIVQTINHKILDFMDRGEIIGAWAQAQIRGVPPVVAYATRKEYDRRKDIWMQFPAAMMRKVPESMVLRRIVGITGVAGEAEIGDGTIVETTAEVM